MITFLAIVMFQSVLGRVRLAPQTISRKNRVAFDKTALRRRFSEDGFVIVEDFLSSEEADRLDRELERFIRMVVPRLEEPDVFHESGSNGPIKHLGRLEVYDSYFEQLQTRPKTLELVAACLGTQTEPIGSEVFYKQARVGSAALYHQDNAYLHLKPADGAVAWIALDETTVENGAVHFARGANWLGDLVHEETNLLLFSKKLSDPPDTAQYPEVPALLRRGDASIHHILTPHRSGPNTTDQKRRGVVLNYKGVNAPTNEARQAAHADYLARLYTEAGIG